MAPGEAATPLAAPLVSGPRGRISPLRMNKTTIRRTTAGITTPLRVAQPHGAVSAPDLGAGGGAKYAPAPPRWSGNNVSGSGDIGATGPDGSLRPWTQPGPAATGRAPATRGRTNCCAASRWQGRGGDGSTPPGTGPTGTPPQDFSGIASALERLAPLMTDADTARNLRWQREVDGDKNKLAAWKLEATGNAGLQFYAYMQPGEAFLVLGHSLSSIYSTTMDVASYHGKIVLFTGDRTHTRECVPVFLPSPAALSWVKCPVVEDKTKLAEWYADNRSEYGKLCDPSPQDGA